MERLIMWIREVNHPAAKIPMHLYQFSCGHQFVGDLRKWQSGELVQPLRSKCGDCK